MVVVGVWVVVVWVLVVGVWVVVVWVLVGGVWVVVVWVVEVSVVEVVVHCPNVTHLLLLVSYIGVSLGQKHPVAQTWIHCGLGSTHVASHGLPHVEKIFPLWHSPVVVVVIVIVVVVGFKIDGSLQSKSLIPPHPNKPLPSQVSSQQSPPS